MFDEKPKFKITFTPQELEEYHQKRVYQQDQQEREEGRFQFNTVFVLLTLCGIAFAFQASPVVIGLCLASFMAWLLWFREGN